LLGEVVVGQQQSFAPALGEIAKSDNVVILPDAACRMRLRARR
jgi:hypothetical protein